MLRIQSFEAIDLVTLFHAPGQEVAQPSVRNSVGVIDLAARSSSVYQVRIAIIIQIRQARKAAERIDFSICEQMRDPYRTADEQRVLLLMKEEPCGVLCRTTYHYMEE